MDLKKINNSKTTVGKTVKTLLWVAFTNAVIAVLTLVTNHPQMYNAQTVSIANVLFVLAKNFFDGDVKNI